MYDAMLQWPIIVSQPIARGMYVFAEVCQSCRILVLVKKKKRKKKERNKKTLPPSSNVMTTYDKDGNHLLFSWLLLMANGWQRMNFKLPGRKGTLCSCVEMGVSTYQYGI